LTAADPATTSIVLRGHKNRISSVAISADSHWIVTGSYDRTARVWDLTAADPAATSIALRGHERGITKVVISADSRWLVTCSYWDDNEENPVRVWDLASVDPAVTGIVLRGHKDKIGSVAISADSRWLITVCRHSNTARLWDLSTPNPAATGIVLHGHKGEITTVAISADSHWLVTGSKDGTARLWDLTAADPAATGIVLRGHKYEITTVAISADSHWLVTGSEDNTLRLWTLRIDELIENACRVAGRNLSYTEWGQYFRGEDYRVSCPDLSIHPNVITNLIATAQSLAGSGDIESAVAVFRRAQKLDPSLDFDPTAEAYEWAVKAHIEKGKQLARQGKLKAALVAYEEAQALDSTLKIPAEAWDHLCWYGSLWGHAADLMNFCEQAVMLKPEKSFFRTSRGLARALTGDIEGAIEDFQVYVDSPISEEERKSFQGWIDALRAGENPFTPEVLELLRSR